MRGRLGRRAAPVGVYWPARFLWSRHNQTSCPCGEGALDLLRAGCVATVRLWHVAMSSLEQSPLQRSDPEVNPAEDASPREAASSTTGRRALLLSAGDAASVRARAGVANGVRRGVRGVYGAPADPSSVTTLTPTQLAVGCDPPGQTAVERAAPAATSHTTRCNCHFRRRPRR